MCAAELHRMLRTHGDLHLAHRTDITKLACNTPMPKYYVDRHGHAKEKQLSVEASVTMTGLDASTVGEAEYPAIKAGLVEVLGNKIDASHISQVLVSDGGANAGVVSFKIANVSLPVSGFSDAKGLRTSVRASLASVEQDMSTLITKIKATSATHTLYDSVTGVSASSTSNLCAFTYGRTVCLGGGTVADISAR